MREAKNAMLTRAILNFTVELKKSRKRWSPYIQFNRFHNSHEDSIYELRTTYSYVGAMICEIWATSCEMRDTSYELRDMIYKIEPAPADDITVQHQDCHIIVRWSYSMIPWPHNHQTSSLADDCMVKVSYCDFQIEATVTSFAELSGIVQTASM